MPMAPEGSVRVQHEWSCSRGITSKTDSIGAPARETACGRGKREGSAPTRRPDASPPRLHHLRVGSGADPIDEGGGLVAAPWERRRITARPEARAAGRHPVRGDSAGCRGMCSKCGIRCPGPPAALASASVPPGARRHPAAASPPLPGDRKETRAHAEVLRPPAGSRISFRRPQISRISAPRRAPRLRGCTARRSGSLPVATRAGGAAGPRRGVDRAGAGQPVGTGVGGPFLLGRGSRSGIRHAGSRRPSSNRGVRPGLHLPSARGSAPESAKSHGGRGEACQRSKGLALGLPAFEEGAELPCGRWQRADAAMPRASPASEVARVKNEGACEVPSARTRGFSQGATRRRRCRPDRTDGPASPGSRNRSEAATGPLVSRATAPRTGDRKSVA